MRSTTTLLAAAFMALSRAAHAAGEHPGHGTHGGYQGDIGPEAWTKLKP